MLPLFSLMMLQVDTNEGCEAPPVLGGSEALEREGGQGGASRGGCWKASGVCVAGAWTVVVDAGCDGRLRWGFFGERAGGGGLLTLRVECA